MGEKRREMDEKAKDESKKAEAFSGARELMIKDGSIDQ